MNTAMLPKSYEEWQVCITVICGQELTLSFVETRIKSLSSTNDHMTRRFVQLYGEGQRAKTLEWFSQAKRQLQA